MLASPLTLPSCLLHRALSSAAALTPDGVQSLRARLWNTRDNDGDGSGSRDAGEAPSDRRGCEDSADEAMVRPTLRGRGRATSLSTTSLPCVPTTASNASIYRITWKPSQEMAQWGMASSNRVCIGAFCRQRPVTEHAWTIASCPHNR